MEYNFSLWTVWQLLEFNKRFKISNLRRVGYSFACNIYTRTFLYDFTGVRLLRDGVSENSTNAAPSGPAADDRLCPSSYVVGFTRRKARACYKNKWTTRDGRNDDGRQRLFGGQKKKKRTEECNRSFFLGNASDIVIGNAVTRERIRYSRGTSRGRRIYELINIAPCKIRNATRLSTTRTFPRRRRRRKRGHGLHGGNPTLRFASNVGAGRGRC